MLLDPDIGMLWEGMLKDVHPELFRAHAPDSASWHKAFIGMAAEDEANPVQLFPLAGVISAQMAVPYPAFDAVDRQFIEDQVVPADHPVFMNYDDIFEHAVCTVAALWRRVELAVTAADPEALPAFGEWNLDTGRDEHDRLVFW